MNNYQSIKSCYVNSGSDASELFREILRVSKEIGLDDTLSLLERCVIEKRLAWAQAHLAEVETTGLPVLDGYRWFYETYLDVSVPEDGEIVEFSDRRIVSRWWNPCPTLEACKKFGLDTRVICKKAYHRPVQEFLIQLHPGSYHGDSQRADVVKPFVLYFSNGRENHLPTRPKQIGFRCLADVPDDGRERKRYEITVVRALGLQADLPRAAYGATLSYLLHPLQGDWGVHCKTISRRQTFPNEPTHMRHL